MMNGSMNADEMRSGGERNPFREYLDNLEFKIKRMEDNIRMLRKDLNDIREVYNTEYRRPR